MSSSNKPDRGDGSSRRGPKRSFEEERRPRQPHREQRGYSINERNTRRRVGDFDNHRNYGRRSGDYYGRGYEERRRGRGREYFDETRPRHGYDNNYGYEDHEPRDSRRRQGSYSRYPEEREWRCVECGIYNYDTDTRCARCGTRSRTMSPCKSPIGSEDDSDIQKAAKKPSFPPPFESGGAAYDFHAASGMFYESISDFFYDPKTKLYYSNKKKVYYNYRPGEDPPFCVVETKRSEHASADAGKETPASKPEDKKRIPISLKTTVLPDASNVAKKPKASKAPKKAKAPPAQPKKRDAANMEVWTERGKEIREDATSVQNVVMTTSNKPVCLLCRRKFDSVEKLKKHEELSDLHKDNLKKKREEEEAKKANMEYRDRALERRLMHGPETAAAPLPVDVQESNVPKKEVVRPEDSLGASNIGNQMLQKLGWKSGSSLGRGTSSTEEDESKVQSSLVKDWQKIEALATSGQYDHRPPSSRGGGIGN